MLFPDLGADYRVHSLHKDSLSSWYAVTASATQQRANILKTALCFPACMLTTVFPFLLIALQDSVNRCTSLEIFPTINIPKHELDEGACYEYTLNNRGKIKLIWQNVADSESEIPQSIAYTSWSSLIYIFS